MTIDSGRDRADNQAVTSTTPVAEPFASDVQFWMSVRASGDALVSLIIATVLTVTLGSAWAAAFVVPAALLVRAGVTGRASARRSRAMFATRDEWRDAERQAVARAIVPALLRQAKNTRS